MGRTTRKSTTRKNSSSAGKGQERTSTRLRRDFAHSFTIYWRPIPRLCLTGCWCSITRMAYVPNFAPNYSAPHRAISTTPKRQPERNREFGAREPKRRTRCTRCDATSPETANRRSTPFDSDAKANRTRRRRPYSPPTKPRMNSYRSLSSVKTKCKEC